MNQWNWLNNTRPCFESVITVMVLSVACFLHFFHVDQLPMGFYVDESSIAYNAYLISTTGADEHGVHWPLFFEAFGEYKNPLYIYVLAGFYRLLGFSEWTTRALSACAWVVGSFYLLQLSRRLFGDHMTRIYVAIIISFTPWLFSLSRISFELISLYPLLAIHLYALYRGFEENSRWWVTLSGFSMGLCVYAYTTFRLLSPLYCVIVLICFSAKRFRLARLLFSIGAAVSLVPFLIYALLHFDNLSARFNIVTYVHDPAMPMLEKLRTFFSNYVEYFGPSFLLMSGDENLRHHTGFGGEFLATTVILFVFSIVTVKKHMTNKFYRYLLVGLILSPFAAALTIDSQHSLRAFPMAVFGIVISAYALHDLSLSTARTIVATTALCALFYILDYFVIYPSISAEAFENYGLKEVLNEALDRAPNRIILSDEGNAPYIDLLFFGTLTHAGIPLLVGSRKDLQPGDAYIFYDTDYKRGWLYSVEFKPMGTVENRVAIKH